MFVEVFEAKAILHKNVDEEPTMVLNYVLKNVRKDVDLG